MKVTKKILALALAFVCAVSVIAAAAPTEAYAATTQTITLIKGEKFAYAPDSTNVKSVSSDKKSVVSVKKNEDESTEIIFTAKEKGTANVTIKTGRGTKKLKVKVVGNAIKIKAVAQAGYDVIYKITNDTSVTFSSLFYFDYTIKDSDGEVLKEGTESVYKLAAKSTAYVSVYAGYGVEASLKKSTAKANLEESKRYLNYKYTDQTKKIKVTVTENVEDKNVKFKVKFKSSVNEYTDVRADLVLYDCDDNIVCVFNISKYLGKKETTTQEAEAYNYADVYDHYKIFVSAYSEEYQ